MPQTDTRLPGECFNDWTLVRHIRTLEEARKYLGDDGRVDIGVWVHEGAGAVIVYWETDADETYGVEVKGADPDREFDETGRYTSRADGASPASSSIMKKWP